MIPKLHSHSTQAGSEASGQRSVVKQEPVSPKPASGKAAKKVGKRLYDLYGIDALYDSAKIFIAIYQHDTPLAKAQYPTLDPAHPCSQETVPGDS